MGFRIPVVLFQKPVNNWSRIGGGFGISTHRFLSSHPRMNFGVGGEFFRLATENARMFHIFFDINFGHPGIPLFRKSHVAFWDQLNFSQKRKNDFPIFQPPGFS
jgi:hypothetical protein